MSRTFRVLISSACVGLAALALRPLPAAAESVTVTQWGALYYGAPYAVALKNGYFAQNKVDIDKIVGGDGGGTTVRNTLAAAIPVGEVSLAAAVEAARSGLPIRIVANTIDSLGDFVLVTRPESPIRSLDDLRGKKLAYTRPGSVSQMATLLTLKARGIAPDQVQLLSVGGVGAVLTAIRNGTVDLAYTGEPIWTREQQNLRAIAWLHDVMDPHFTQIVAIADEAYAKAHPDVVRGILAARRQGVRFIYEHPEEAADIVAAAYDQDPGLVRKVFASLAKLNYWSEGQINVAAMRRMAEGLSLIGAVEGEVPFDRVIDRSYLPADLQVH